MSQVKIPTTNDIKQIWNNFSEIYTSSYEFEMLPLYISLFNLCSMRQVKESDKILELSVGGGLGFKYLIENSTSNHIYGGDISELMIESCNKSVELLKSTQSIKKNIHLSIIDNENIEIFKDNEVKKVISNLSLHLVSDPNKMLSEIYRILDKNDKTSSLALSVWGRIENNFYMRFISEIYKRNNIELPSTRSNFHLSDMEEVRKLMKENGFKINYMKYISIPLSFRCFDDIKSLLNSPVNLKIMKDLNEDLKKKIIDEVKIEFEKEIELNGRVEFEGLIIHAVIA